MSCHQDSCDLTVLDYDRQSSSTFGAKFRVLAWHHHKYFPFFPFFHKSGTQQSNQTLSSRHPSSVDLILLRANNRKLHSKHTLKSRHSTQNRLRQITHSIISTYKAIFSTLSCFHSPDRVKKCSRSEAKQIK